MRDWVAANTPTLASDREEVAGPASSSNRLLKKSALDPDFGT
jgi:hypothetical protein